VSDRAPVPEEDVDPRLQRIVEDRKPGEIESGMLTGSDEADLSATERFEGELSPEEALEVLDPDHERAAGAGRAS
jgi:hypothetical protein